MNVTATYTINQYTATFKDWNGDTLSTSTVDYNTAATAPSDPTRTGYTFAGWDVAFTNVVANMNVTATYTINQYTVTFDKNTGDTNADPTTRTADYDTTVTLPAAPTKTGYTFASWNTQADGSGSGFTASTPFTATITVYAKWLLDLTSIDTAIAAANDAKVGVVLSEDGTGLAAGTKWVNAFHDEQFTLAITTATDAKSTVTTPEEVADVVTELNKSLTLYNYAKADAQLVTFSVIGGHGTLVGKMATLSGGVNPPVIGDVAISSGTQVLKGNQQVAFIATPDAGYTIKEWTVTGVYWTSTYDGSFSTYYSDILFAPVTVTVEFRLYPSILTTIQVDTGYGSVVTNVINTAGLQAVKVANGTTVGDLLWAIIATDRSLQGYVVTDSAGTQKTEGTLVTGDKLRVTSEDASVTATYAITVP